MFRLVENFGLAISPCPLAEVVENVAMETMGVTSLKDLPLQSFQGSRFRGTTPSTKQHQLLLHRNGRTWFSSQEALACSLETTAQQSMGPSSTGALHIFCNGVGSDGNFPGLG